MREHPMHAVVCMKLVPDPDGPAQGLRIDAATAQIVASGVPPAFGPFDETALELALRLKEASGARITVLTAGEAPARRVLVRALAAGADEVVVVQGAELRQADAFLTASVLARALDRLRPFDLVLCGRQAADTDGAQVGIGIASLLDLPGLTLVNRLETGTGTLRAYREVAGGLDVYEVDTPAVFTVKNDRLGLRYLRLPALQAAMKRPMTSFSVAELGVDAQAARRVRVASLSHRAPAGRCEMVAATDCAQLGRALALRLAAEGAI
jgi:electron transfer flavoprotein beta subunit